MDEQQSVKAIIKPNQNRNPSVMTKTKSAVLIKNNRSLSYSSSKSGFGQDEKIPLISMDDSKIKSSMFSCCGSTN